MMEDRSSPPATTSYYRPPLGVRHLASVSARNVVPPGGPPKRLAGVGVFFTLHECSSAPSDDANGVVSGSASSGRDLEHMGHGTRGALYTSEVVRDTLNPDWAPLDEALIDAAASARTSSGENAASPPATPRFDAGDAETRETPIRIGGVAKETSRVIHRRRVSLHERVILRVWFVPAPSPGASAGATRESPRAFRGDARTRDDSSSMTNDDDSRTRMAFQCDISMGALVPLPGGTRGQKLVSLSMSGGRARAGAVLSAPPNTPLLRTRAGAFGRDPSRASPGSIHRGRVSILDRRDRSTDPVSGLLETDPLNPHDGWVVPRSKAWPALLAAAEAAKARDDAAAAATEASLSFSSSGADTAAASADAHVTDVPDAVTDAVHPATARATTRQIRVASEAILDATRRLRTAAVAAARLKARVRANVERASPSLRRDDPDPCHTVSRIETNAVFDPAARAASAEARLETLRSRRATLAAAIETARAETETARAATRARASSLGASRDALRGAEARLRDADAILRGPHGLGRLRSAQRALVTRRWRLVGDLARVFPVTAFGASAEAADARVFGAADEREREASGDESSSMNPALSSAPVASNATASSFPLAVAGVPLDHTGSIARARQSLPSNVGGSGFDPGVDAGATRTLLNDPECAAAALGYVTQATLQLASVLDVPLRYPVAPGASRSYICDLQQVFSAEHGSDIRSGGGGGAGGEPTRFDSRDSRDVRSGSDSKSATTAVSGPALWRRVEFPLFAEPHAAEGTRFAYAVFLLNKDLEQLLNAHGLLAVGPRHTLQNLKRLFAARKKIVAADFAHDNTRA